MADEINPPPGGAVVDADTDSIINDILGQQAAQADEQLLRAERGEEQKPQAERREPPKEPTKPTGEKPHDKEASDFSDVDKLEASDRLKQIDEALAKGDTKKAFRLAFKRNPEFFQVNEAKFTALRERERLDRLKSSQREREHVGKVQQFQSEVQQTIARLTPYEQLYQVQHAFQQSGDTTLLVRLIEGLTGLSYDDAQKAILHKQRRSPGERALQERLNQLERQLTEKEQHAQRQSQQQTLEQQRQSDIAHIRNVLASDPVAKIPKFDERIYRILEKHYDPRLGGLTITVEEAARRLERAERKRLESSPFYKPTNIETKPEPKALPQATPTSTFRRDSQNNGSLPENETDDDIIKDIAGQIARSKFQQRRAS